MFRLLFLISICVGGNIFALNYFFIFNQNSKILNKPKTYTLCLNDNKDIFIANDIKIKLIIPKEKCNYKFLKNIYFINSSNNDKKIYVDNYYVGYYKKSFKKVCIANYYIPKQKPDELYQFMYGTLSNVILILERNE